jgi:dTDP-glucose pyrophosphorylase
MDEVKIGVIKLKIDEYQHISLEEKPKKSNSYFKKNLI